MKSPSVIPPTDQQGQQGAVPLAAGSVLDALRRHMSDVCNFTPTDSELSEIVRIVNAELDERLRWWIANAKAIANERGDLFRAGESLAAQLSADADQTEKIAKHFDESLPDYCVGARALVAAWNVVANPIREMTPGNARNHLR